MIANASLQAKLEIGLDVMGLKISADKQVKLVAFVMLINKWNKIHNLTAVREPMDMVTLHLLDSLSVLPDVQALAPKRLLDVGAGAGLPSIPLAICLPELQVVAIDAVQKKASFMRQAKGELGLDNFHVEAGRVEALNNTSNNSTPKFDVIISRAFSEIGLFIELTKHLLSSDGVWLAMKGTIPHHEFEKSIVKPTEIKPLNVADLEAERHLVILHPSIDTHVFI